MVQARREVIVAAGTYNSPQLLQVSGIGPTETLAKFDIPVVAALRGVGENLQNHISVSMKYECNRAITVNDVVNNPIRRIITGLQYILFRKGALATSAFTVAGMIRTDPMLPAPDVKLQLQKWTRTHKGRGKERIGLDRRSSFSVGVQLGHPNERGTVRIKSPDTAIAPLIHFNYAFPDGDQQPIVVGMRAVRTIVGVPPMNSLVVGEIEPGLKCNTDEELKQFFRTTARPSVHPTSTCKMGVDDMAVVDPRLCVRGVRNLRVIDASIMPQIVAANTNATTIMIAEKGAAMVLEDARA